MTCATKPLHERRRILQDILGEADLPQIAFRREVPGTGPEVFEAAEPWASRASSQGT
jgi:ATP-dependent DNA ligase